MPGGHVPEISHLPVFVYSSEYNLDLGGHVFPALKFGIIYDALKSKDEFKNHTFLEPAPVTVEQAALVHSQAYLDDLIALKPTAANASSELPLSAEIIERFFLASGGTLLAARFALEKGIAMNLGGGFHHAFKNRAEGFCYLNDVAIAIKVLQKEKRINKALVIDVDVHQGNGTARIFRFQTSVFTFSVHEENNYPRKEKSNLDIGLETGCNDEEYLQALSSGLATVKKKFEPDIIFYLAGADAHENDKLGGLSLTFDGMKKRDQVIRDFLPGVPVVLLLAGGYGVNTDDTVNLHIQTCEVFSKRLE